MYTKKKSYFSIPILVCLTSVLLIVHLGGLVEVLQKEAQLRVLGSAQCTALIVTNEYIFLSHLIATLNFCIAKKFI